MRRPGVYQRQRHMPGRWFSTTAGRFLEYESLLERDWMLLMDFDREVEWICEQPLRLRYARTSRPASHVPDLLVWRAGAPELCDVKSEERLEDPEFLAQVEATGLACAEAGLGLPGAVGAGSAAAGERAVAGGVPRAACRIWTVSARGCWRCWRSVASTIGELLAGAREPMLARPVLMHLLWAGEATG